MDEIKQSGQAMGAKALTDLTDLTSFAPPNIVSQASRLAVGRRWFNLVVTNVPGPQFPLFMVGREMHDLIPMVPLAPNQALGVAIMSYNGRINFGLVGDYDVMYDLDDIAHDFEVALAELAAAAGVMLHGGRPRRSREQPTNGQGAGRRIGTSETVPVGRSEERDV
jgi:hypothetical protein